MRLRMIAPQVLDVAANEQALIYARRDTKADGSSFASFHFCSWETLQCRPVAESAFLNLKFGGLGAHVADALHDVFSCKAAPLPDGGCAVLRPDGMLCLYRPNGALGGMFSLEYKGCPAWDIVGRGGDIWFTAPMQDAVVLFSLERREMLLRVGGEGVFSLPKGLGRSGNALAVCCGGARAVKTLLLPGYTLGETVSFESETATPERYFSIYRRNFACIHGGLYAMHN